MIVLTPYAESQPCTATELTSVPLSNAYCPITVIRFSPCHHPKAPHTTHEVIIKVFEIAEFLNFGKQYFSKAPKMFRIGARKKRL